MFEGTRSSRTVPMTVLSGNPGGCGYQIEQSKDFNDIFFVRWGSQICLFERADNQWALKSATELRFLWNEGSFDHEKRKIYIYDSAGSRLVVLDFNRSRSFITRQVPLDLRSQFPFSLHQAYDAKRGILYLVSLESRLAGYDLVDFTKVRKSPVNRDLGQIVEMVYDEKTDRLIVLQVGALTFISGQDGSVLRTVPMIDKAFGLFVDHTSDRMFISFPDKMAVGIMPVDGYEVTKYLDAPVGVRSVQIDPERSLIFMGSFSGVLEIRSLENNHLLGRTRLSPWIHWLSVMPEYGDIIVTHGESRSIAYHYAHPIIDHDLFGYLEWQAEKWLRTPFLSSLLKIDLAPEP